MTLLKRVRVLAIKKEATLGLGLVADANDAYMNVYDATIEPNLQMLDRQSQGSGSMLPSVVGTRGGTAKFKTELYLGGVTNTSPLWMELLFPACGYTQATDTFSPTMIAPAVSATAPTTVTISSYENGLRKTISGAMGTFVISCKAGEIITFDWTFTGVWEGEAGGAPVVDDPIIAPTYDTDIPLRFAGVTFTVGSGPTCTDTLTIDAGNNVVLRPCGTDGTGYAHAIIPNRKITGTMDPESELIATAGENVHAEWLAGTEVAFSFLVGDGTDTFTVSIPKLQRTNIQPADRSDIQVDNVTFQANKNAAAGDDEMTMTVAAV